MTAVIGQEAPPLSVSEWVQGMPLEIGREKDHVVLVEVFQINCPGCFMYGIPQAIQIYEKYHDEGVRVAGIATAFEDYDKNTLENLKMLTSTGQVVGETLKILGQYGKLDGDRLGYKIPFPLGMDSLTKMTDEPAREDVMKFIHAQLPLFDSQQEHYRAHVISSVTDHLRAKEYLAGTFEEYALRGTPSTILVDRKGILRDVSFGSNAGLEQAVRSLAGI